MLDDKLWDVDRNLIPSLDKNNVLSLSAENCKKIDGLVSHPHLIHHIWVMAILLMKL
ncbi:hypothetical protein HF847_08090 [Clostridium cochlearium]|nr:hypothetical protein [Clostridium cochlearium]